MEGRSLQIVWLSEDPGLPGLPGLPWVPSGDVGSCLLPKHGPGEGRWGPGACLSPAALT